MSYRPSVRRLAISILLFLMLVLSATGSDFVRNIQNHADSPETPSVQSPAGPQAVTSPPRTDGFASRKEQTFASLLCRSPLGANTNTILLEAQAILPGPLEGREARENQNQHCTGQSVRPCYGKIRVFLKGNLVLGNTTAFVHRDCQNQHKIKVPRSSFK